MPVNYKRQTSEKAFILIVLLILFAGCAKDNNSDAEARPSADWIKNAVIYEVNLHSFSEEGSFIGLEKRIHELKNIGVNVISLLPVHPVGELNRRGSLGNPYAVQDYYAINPEFGTAGDFHSLVDVIHRDSMKIVIHFAPGYAAWDSQVLMEYPDWFIHDEEGAIVSPEIDLPDAAQMDLNQHEPKKYMIAAMKYWIKEFDIDGYNIPAAGSVPVEFWNLARKELDKMKSVMMISGPAKPEYNIKAFDLTSSWNIFEMLNSINNRNMPASILDDSLKNEFIFYPHGSLHQRFDGLCGGNGSSYVKEKLDSETAKILAVLKFTVPGVPYLYNGEETGAEYNCSYEKIEIDWPGSNVLKELYELLGVLRKKHEALTYGSYIPVQNSEIQSVFSFLRYTTGDSVISVINFSNERKKIKLKMPAGSAPVWKNQLSDEYIQMQDSTLTITLPSMSFASLAPSSERTAI